MSTIEKNKLIAEFMGIELVGGGQNLRELNPDLDKYFRKTTYARDGLCDWCHNGVSHGHSYRCYVIDDNKLKYHSSWDWLMPCIEKINLDYEGLPDKWFGHISISSPIEVVYESVVDLLRHRIS